MMNELIDTLHNEQCTLVLLHEGNIHQFSGRGARTLYNLLTEEPEALLNSKIAAKAVGTTAAKMMVEGEVCEVYADIISEQAYTTLQDAGIKVSFERRLNHTAFIEIWKKMGELTA
ncbi:MAG TPA: DUF1893 domain-containing protein [Prevotella sp.]